MLFKTSLLAVLLLVQSALVQSMIDQSVYVLGAQGRSCSEVCVDSGMNCNPHVVTDNSPDRFFELGLNCTLDTRNWWAHDQPCFVSDPADPNYGKCLGWVRVPGGVMCHSAAPSVQRLCRCDPPSKEFVEFGTGVAGVDITPKEQMVYAHTVAEGDVGVITHFWTTYRSHVDNGTIVRFYVDDEVAPSLRFTPSMASGVGFYDNTAPWGNEMIGKAALDGGWYINVRVPFSKNIRVTVQHARGTFDHLYVLVRGGVNIPIRVGEVDIPRSARLRLFAIDQHLEPYDWATLADVPAGQSGLMFFITMSAASQAVGFLEGCIHLYTSARPEFPGLILGTGTEDYFDSAWFFNGGQYRLPNSGFTHLVDQPNRFEWSAYRFHINDPIRFTNGMRFVWRNGDLLDASGIKCLIPDLDGPPANPDTTATDLSSYVWVYTWPAVEKASASAVA